jgi:hypothetical protein
MNSQIERLKEKSIQFTLEMVKKRLDDFLIDEIIETDDKFKEIEILFKDIETHADLKILKDFFKLNKSKLSKDLYENYIEELREITSDLKWSNSKQGIQVLKLEEWVINARKAFAEVDEFKTVFIGRSMIDPTLLIISGVLNGALQEEKLKEKIEYLNPPTQPKYIIETPLTST